MEQEKSIKKIISIAISECDKSREEVAVILTPTFEALKRKQINTNKTESRKVSESILRIKAAMATEKKVGVSKLLKSKLRELNERQKTITKRDVYKYQVVVIDKSYKTIDSYFIN